MKKLMTATVATLMFAAPLAAAPAASADEGHRGHYSRGHDNDRWDDRRDDRRAYRHGRRDQRRLDRWDDRHYNGYWSGGRFYYGPPPHGYRGDYRYDYRAWRRGDRLPAYYANRYRAYDWRRAHLRAPPRGYHYVYGDRDEVLLVGIATGVILGVILAN